MCKSEKCQRHVLEGVGTNKAKFLSFLTIGSTDTIPRSHEGCGNREEAPGATEEDGSDPTTPPFWIGVGSTAPGKIFPAADTNS